MHMSGIPEYMNIPFVINLKLNVVAVFALVVSCVVVYILFFVVFAEELAFLTGLGLFA